MSVAPDPAGRSGKSPEGFGRIGLSNDAFQDRRCAHQMDYGEDRPRVYRRLGCDEKLATTLPAYAGFLADFSASSASC